MSETPYEFIETEDEQDDSTDDEVDVDWRPRNDSIAAEAGETEGSDHETVLGENVENPDPSPTLLESIIGLFRSLVR